jgi:hypothetical protein
MLHPGNGHGTDGTFDDPIGSSKQVTQSLFDSRHGDRIAFEYRRLLREVMHVAGPACNEDETLYAAKPA